MQAIKGGFAFNPTDEQLINRQRAITANINNNFIQVGASFLNMSSKSPTGSDWYRRKFRDTNLQDWIDNPDHRALNVGFNLQFGWLDVDIDSGDPLYNTSILAAMKFLNVDTRFAFGRASKGVPSHLMVQLTDSDIANYDSLKEFEPKEFRLSGQRYKTELRSMGAASNEQIKQARQTVMPGSIYSHKTDPGKYDISVWYSDDGRIAQNVTAIAETTPRKAVFATLITGIALGTFLYVFRPHWVEGSRQQTAIKVAGWLARLIVESRSMNENDISAGVFCPCNDINIAERMLDFFCTQLQDHEAHMRKRLLREALQKLENNPDARIPGWPVLEGQIGSEAVLALRTVFMPGIDVSPLTKMADTYLYDDSEDVYIDRVRFVQRRNFTHDGQQLERRHENEFIEIGDKLKPLFRVYRTSSLRKRVVGREMHPDLPAGALFRLSRQYEVIPDEDISPDAVILFNTWNGWPTEPTTALKPELLDKCNQMLDRLLGYLTQENKQQAEWLKMWVAWTVQHPGQKQQIAPVIVGGQGVGKSFFGNTFLERLFRNLWGSASPKALETSFSVEPFIGKMFVFIDEAKFYNESSTDEIKKIIRNTSIAGSEKYRSSTTYNIFARVIFASNRFDINISAMNFQDRALFYTKAYDNEYLGMTDAQFRNWAVSLKPFFAEFDNLLKQLDAREHFMHIFQTLPVDQQTIESTALSSSNDKHIVEANMSYSRRLAKRIVEDGRIWEDLDISAPFPMGEFERRVIDMSNQMGLRNVRSVAVFNEFRDNNLVEQVMTGGRAMYRFKYKIASLLDKYGEAIGCKLDVNYGFSEDDYGQNDSDLERAKPWRGRNARFRNGI